MDNELTTLDAVEREIRALYNGKYQSARTFTRSLYFVTTWPENISLVIIRDIFISLFGVLSSCRKLSGYASGDMCIDKLIKIFYDFMIYTFKAVYLTF